MDSYEVSRLQPGEIMVLRTETGSAYHLKAEESPERLSEAANLFRGFRATRESDHQLEGRPEIIEDEPAKLIVRSGKSDGVIHTGDFVELIWDRDHPDEREWDMQFGPKFHPLSTSRILNIEVIPVEEN